MNILAIETSCDETGVCLLSAEGFYPDTEVSVETNELASQIEDHQEYGGVFPSLAKRLHGKNFPTLLKRIFSDTNTKQVDTISETKKEQVREWLKRHDQLAEHLFSIIKDSGLPDLDGIAVTVGPGLEPALWVGINVARSLALILDVPVIPTNHMEGHVMSALAPDDISDGRVHQLANITFPAITLLVSGGHTELIRSDSWGKYKKIGQTRDDAAGEAFDKVGRLLGFPYPAGPHVSALANNTDTVEDSSFSLPRPMIDSDDFDFSFSGLKTAAARLIAKHKPLSDKERAQFAYELEEAIIDVLVQKTKQAVKETKARSLLVGGGVSANKKLRKKLKTEFKKEISIHLSPLSLTGDNAVMIGLAATQHYEDGVEAISDTLVADSRLSL